VGRQLLLVLTRSNLDDLWEGSWRRREVKLEVQDHLFLEVNALNLEFLRREREHTFSRRFVAVIAWNAAGGEHFVLATNRRPAKGYLRLGG